MSTDFQIKVYNAVAHIPIGYVTTYKNIAAYINCKSARAVGQALKHNPYAPKVPCHRVIASDLTVGGFQGSKASGKVQKKIKLLEQEGVKFKNNKLTDKKLVYYF
jgi:methylated-DNA-[protein]-cysteine S-methyltransferase